MLGLARLVSIVAVLGVHFGAGVRQPEHSLLAITEASSPNTDLCSEVDCDGRYYRCISTCFDTCGGQACSLECGYDYGICEWQYCGGPIPDPPILPC
jgi:hypothetical protein